VFTGIKYIEIMKRHFFYRYFLFLFLLQLTLPVLSQACDKDTVLIVTTKSGKTFTFINKSLPGFAVAAKIEEWHYSRKGYIVGGENQPFPMFDIKIVSDEFSKILSLRDVESIRFLDIRKGVFKIAISTKDKKILTLSLQGPYLDIENEDGIRGIEIKEGEIQVPFTKVKEIKILVPMRIHTYETGDIVTEAKLEPAR
jgi:hypothetical protein